MSWEVRAMRSVTSCFNFTLLRKNLARFWPIWGLYSLIWLVLLPVALLTESGRTHARFRLLPLNFLANGGWSSAALLFAFFFGILSAMAVFSYLYSARSVSFLHALPMRREGLFLTNYVSGLAFLLLPNGVVFLLSLAIEAGFGVVEFSSLFTWLVVTSLYCLFFYSFAVFCAMFTGHILALPAFYVILNFLVAWLTFLLRDMASRFLFGFTGATWLEDLAVWLTPMVFVATHTGISYGPLGDQSACFTGLGYVALLALVGLVLAALALVVYRRRQLESAGDVVSVGWVRPVFQYGVAFCCAITLGNFFYSIFASLLPRNAWVLLGWMLLWGACGCFIAAMLLRKSFWVFKACWKGCGVFLVCLAVAMSAMELDLTGFESRVPAAEQVEAVYIRHAGSYPDDDMHWLSREISDPALIEQVLALHQSIADNKSWLEEQANTRTGAWESDENGVDLEVEGGVELGLSYTLTDGSVLQRGYYLPVSDADLADPNSPAAQLQALLNTPGLAEYAYFGSLPEDARLVDVVLTAVSAEPNVTLDGEYVPAQALDALEEAIHADLAAGNLGRRYLLQDRERLENCCYCDLQLTYRVNAPASNQTVEVDTGRPTGSAYPTTTVTVTITLQKSAENTLAVLAEYGFDESMFPSLYQQYASAN